MLQLVACVEYGRAHGSACLSVCLAFVDLVSGVGGVGGVVVVAVAVVVVVAVIVVAGVSGVVVDIFVAAVVCTLLC